MEIRQLKKEDAKQFSDLILNMYSNLENLEWFSPMPLDIESVKEMIDKPRFFIIGAFENGELAGVSSLDYKCGKLVGKVEFPQDCNTEKLVEIGFNLVNTRFRGRKIMQSMIEFLIDKLKLDSFENAFVKIHKDNIASQKSCRNKGFELWKDFKKPVSKQDFINLASQSFFSKTGKENAKKTLEKFKNNEEIIVDYQILIKKI